MTTRDAAVEGKFAVRAEGLFPLKSERRPQGSSDLPSAGPSPTRSLITGSLAWD
jgi:hypothetical protein